MINIYYYYNNYLIQRVGSHRVAWHASSDQETRSIGDVIQPFGSNYCYNDKPIIDPCPF